MQDASHDGRASSDRMNYPFVGIPSFLRAAISTDLERLDADVAVMGVPTDEGSPFMPGSRFGPRGIREHSHFIETYSPELDRDLEDLRLFDGGDLDVEGPTTLDALEGIARQVADRVPPGKRCLFLGGDHTVTYPILKALAPRWTGLSVIQLDAHLFIGLSRHAIDFFGGPGLSVRY